MRVCKDHWAMMRAALEERGLSGLIDKDGETATARAMSELRGEPQGDDFDPLMSMNWHWMNDALRNGGLYLMNHDIAANPDNEGHYCPVCEFGKHMQGFDAAAEIGTVADEMQKYARERGLIPAVS